jgi:c-di-GMP-binding flagellar brake protein YcgR
MERGELLDIYFWRDRDASYQFESEVLGQSGGRLLITILKHVDDIERIQRRQYHRIDTSIPVTIVPVTRDELEGSEGKGLQWDQPGLSGYIINLSGAGLALAARFPLKPDDLIFVELPADDEGCLPVIAKILAVNRREATDEFIMNAEFVGVSADSTERIFRLIYSQAKQKAAATA